MCFNRPRFSIALLLFLLLPASLHAKQDTDLNKAITRLESIGAILTTNNAGHVTGLQFPEGTNFDPPDWHLIGQLTNLKELDLGALYVGNDMMKHVGKLTELRRLNLFGNPLDSVALNHIESLQNLETLYLYRTFIDDEGIDSIAKLKKLRRLNMFDTFLTDKGLKKLGACKQLHHLSIGNSKAGKFPESFFSKASLDRLRADLTNTRITIWGNTDRLDVPDTIQKPSIKRSLTKAPIPNLQPLPADDLSKRSGFDWECFLGPNRNGKSSETGIHTAWNREPPKLLWHRKIGTGYASPIVSKGRLLLYHRIPRDDESRFREELLCLNGESGEQLWKVDFPTDYEDLNGYGNGPRSTPLVDGNRIFLFSPSGIARCLQLVDGKMLWEVDLVGAFQCEMPTYGMGASPVTYKDMVLFVVGGRNGDDQTHTIVALDKANGVFRYGVGEQPASYATPVITENFGRPWCFVFGQDGLLGFNPDNGKFDFEFPWRANIAGCANAATPVVAKDQIFISESYKLGGAMLRFGPAAPIALWKDSRQFREKSMACHWNTPILENGFLYGCSGRHRSSGILKCVEWGSGLTRWKMKLDGRSSLTYIDGHFLNQSESGLLTLFQATPNGYIECGRLDATNSKVVPSYPAWTAPTVAKGLMYLRGKHELICYDLKRDREPKEN